MAFSFSLDQRTQSNKGFTLIELLIVVAIMGILTATVAFSIREMIYRGKVAKAQGDMNSIAKAILQLELDTAQQPSGRASTGCGGDAEASITSQSAIGLLNNDAGTFNNWRGPYIDQIPTDPWGTAYVFDPDYYCEPEIKGCEKVGTAKVKAMHSRGENKSAINTYDEDDIVLIMCQT